MKESCKSSHSRRYDDATKRALQDIDSKLISLGQLAGQLGSFIGESDVVKKAVVNAIIAVINSNEELKAIYSPYVTNLSVSDKSADKAVGTLNIGQLKQKVENEIVKISAEIIDIEQRNKLPNYSPPSPSPSADSAELQSKLEALEKVKELCEIYENSKNSKNEPKKLLDNLCDGLQTFLGFNSESKGYTGDGIVYSDLDRLCDGVMGFLSGVLGAVKDDEAVKTYDNYMPDENKLDKVLNELNTKIGSGRTGLAESVAAVKAWLEGYDNTLWSMTSAVTDGLSTLIGKLNKDSKFGAGANYYHAVIEEADKELGNQLDKWMIIIKDIEQEVTTIKTKHVNKLDNALKCIVLHKFNVVQTSLKILADSVNDKAFITQVNKADRDLEAQRTKVLSEIDTKLKAMHKKFNDNCGNIISNIERIDNLRAISLEPLLKSTTQLLRDVRNAHKDALRLDSEYNSMIVVQMRHVEEKVAQLDCNAVDVGLQNVCDTVSRQLVTLRGQLAELTKAAHEITESLKDTLEYFQASGDTALYVGEQITGLKNEIRGKIRDYVSATLPSMIQTKLEFLTDHIANGDSKSGSKNGLLDQMVEGVKSFAKSFQSKFTEAIGTIVTKIVDEEGGAVRSYVHRYVASNDTRFPSTITEHDAKREALRDAIKETITTKIAEVGRQSVIDSNSGKVEVMLQSISTFLHMYAKEVDPKRVSGVAGEVVKQRALSAATSLPANDYRLKYIVQTALTAVNRAAESMGTELERFIAACQPGNVNAAISGIKKLAGIFAKEFQSTGPALHGTAQTLGNSINDSLGEKLTDAQIDTKIGQLLKEAVEKGINRLGTRVSDILNGDLGRVEATIGGQVERLQKHPTGDIRSHVNTLGLAIVAARRLVVLTKASAGGTIKDQVESLKVQVGELKDLSNVIDDMIVDFNTALQESIKTARFTVEEANQTVSADVVRVQNEMAQSVRDAFITVYTDVKNMFAERHKTELQSLKTLLEIERNELYKVMNDDIKSGIKGLMTVLKDNENNFVELMNSNHMNLLASYLDIYLMPITYYIQNQVESHAKGDKQMIKEFNLLCMVSRNLLVGLSDAEHFNHDISTRICKLPDHVNDLQPKDLPDSGRPVLRALQHGMTEFCRQLQQQYVSRYSMQTADWKNERDGQNCAKVFMTILSTLFTKLHYLFYSSLTAWPLHKVVGGKSKEENALNDFLVTCSYKIESLVKSRTGTQIAGRLHKGFNAYGEFHKEPQRNRTFDAYLGSINKTNGVVSKLVGYLDTYYATCHLTLPESAKYPCSIRDMMSWIGGLPYTNVYKKVPDHCHSVLNRKNEMTDKYPNKDDEVMHGVLTYRLRDSLAVTCSMSLNVLVTICGNGRGFDQADYRYACEFASNARGFHYPTDVPSLFDMLTDVCRRLLCSLNFVRIRCKLTASSGNGWAGCKYGQAVVGYEWPCNDHSKGKTNDQPNCQPKSPLQAHLMDRLPGCLPHKLTSVGCKSSCSTCSRGKPGQVCIAPMGFWDLSESASTCGTGKQIADALSKLCKDAESPLCVLLHCLQSLTPTPPKTLADMIALYSQIFRELGPADTYRRGSAQYTDNSALKSHFTGKSIVAALPLPIWLHNNFSHGRLTDALTNLYHSNNDHNTPPSENDEDTNASSHSDLSSLTLRSNCSKSKHCGPYLQPLHFHAYHTYPQMHATVYMSWFIYTAWELWEQLQELLSALQQISCKHFGCAKCACRAGKHGDELACKCSSVAHCGGVLPTIYKYGFMFGKTERLVDEHKGKSCYNFCNQLDRVVRSKHFSTLFTVIDDFLFAIRTPFFYTTVSLWLLSFLYLICVMVGRLDVLHIRSHLRIPSSHRITAQSLLAAAQVGRLAKISYLQP